MFKVDEKVDLSRKVLDINVESPIFNEMLDNLNVEVARCIKKVYDKEFSSGEISLKLTIEIPETYKEFPKVTEYGEVIQELYKYRRPNFKHQVTTTLKKQFKQEGTYSEEREVQLDDSGNFVAIPLKSSQVTMFDEDHM